MRERLNGPREGLGGHALGVSCLGSRGELKAQLRCLSSLVSVPEIKGQGKIVIVFEMGGIKPAYKSLYLESPYFYLKMSCPQWPADG